VSERSVLSTGDIDSRRPEGVVVASLWLTLVAVVTLLKFSVGVPLSSLSLFVLALSVVSLVVAFGVWKLKKWAYWGFLGVVTLIVMDKLTDIMLLLLGMLPNIEFTIIYLVSLILPVFWVGYFCQPQVKKAFDVRW